MTRSIGMERLDANTIRLTNSAQLDIQLFANEQVPIDRASIQEVATLAEISDTISGLRCRGFFGDYPAALDRAVLTPDFHKGAGIPVGTVLDADGFVLPRSAGADIGCGMHLRTTNLTREQFDGAGDDLDGVLRHLFFEGGRDVPLDETARAAMLRDGLISLHPPQQGLWRHMDPADMMQDLERTHRLGSWPTRDLWMFADYVRGAGGVSRDAVLGSIGGGNHFVEIQYVDECLERHTCWDWGLRPNMIVIMAHSGSVGLGSMVGGHFTDFARALHPNSFAMPQHGFHPLPTVGPHDHHGLAYLSAMGLACNFAVANRRVLAEMVMEALRRVLHREVSGKLIYDAPHNLVWSEGQRHLHRKGATPAECDAADLIFPTGHPVIIPGSMGDASYLMRGHGSVRSLCSAPHGAGRKVARGAARQAATDALSGLRVVTKIDLDMARPDIAAEYRKDLMEESPDQYKPVQPVIDTVAHAGIATPVARLRPLLTIKG